MAIRIGVEYPNESQGIIIGLGRYFHQFGAAIINSPLFETESGGGIMIGLGRYFHQLGAASELEAIPAKMIPHRIKVMMVRFMEGVKCFV